MKIDGLGHQSIKGYGDVRSYNETTDVSQSQVKAAGSVSNRSDDVQEEEVITEELLDESVKQANKSLDVYDKMIERSVHEKTKAVMYVLKDTRTNEVIREFPPKKIQDMIAKMWELAGLFVDEKA